MHDGRVARRPSPRLSAPVKRSKGKRPNAKGQNARVAHRSRQCGAVANPSPSQPEPALDGSPHVGWRRALNRQSGHPCSFCCQQIIPPPTAPGLTPASASILSCSTLPINLDDHLAASPRLVCSPRLPTTSELPGRHGRKPSSRHPNPHHQAFPELHRPRRVR